MSPNNFFCLALVSLLSVACSHVDVKKNNEEIVRERSQARLEALLAKDIAAAWEFATPAYRKANSVSVFNKRVAGSGTWEAANVDSVVCEEDRCDVKTLVTYYLPVLKVRNTRPMDEVWIKVDGQWWIYQK